MTTKSYTMPSVATIPASSKGLVVIDREDLARFLERAMSEQYQAGFSAAIPVVTDFVYDRLRTAGQLISTEERATLTAKAALSDELRAASLAPASITFPDRMTVDIASLPPSEVSIERDPATGKLTGASVK